MPISPGNVLVCSDEEIVQVTLISPLTRDTLLLPSIGFIPVASITPAGLANTSVDPGYFYQVTNVPFGGLLPVMVNYLRAASIGGQYYRVLVDGVARTDQFHGAVITGAGTVPATISAQTLAGQPGYYRVLLAAELETWIPDSPPGCYLDSTSLTSAQTHKIVVEVVNLVNGSPHVIETSPTVTVYVDNNPCRAGLTVAPEVSAACGFIAYGNRDEDVRLTLAPSQPENFAVYSFTLIKGQNSLTVPPQVPQSGRHVSAVLSPVTLTVAQLLGDCTVAGFAADLYVAASANSGWWRQSQYDAQALAAFAIAPA